MTIRNNILVKRIFKIQKRTYTWVQLPYRKKFKQKKGV